MKVAVLGLGAMGLPMAKHIVAAGHDVVVWNRTPRALEGAQVAASPAQAARGADAVVTMLPDDRVVEEVIAAAGLQPEQIHISMSTIGVACARRLAAAQALVSAPVFGRPEAAAAGKLWVIAAGAPAHLERVRPVLEAVGQGVLVAGEEPASANVIKLAGNFWIAAQIETFGELFTLAEGAGVAAAQVLAIFKQTLLRSPIAENYAALIAERRFRPAGFRAALGRKDMQLVLALSRLPLAELMDQHLAALPADIDWAAMGTGSRQDQDR
jgi:3-hydroxyisobutyrate dehydrogenase-like beta-hydroxyacid dehydrogenase